MSDAETQKRFDEWFKASPIHDCPGLECEHGPSFYLLVSPSEVGDPGEFSVSSETHNITPEQVVITFIQSMDHAIQDARPDDMPASIAWTYGRELMKKLIEEVEPPGEINANIASFIDQMMNEMRQEQSDE